MAVQAALVRLFRKLRHVETYRRQGFKRLLNGHEFGRLISLVRLGCAMDDLNCPARIPLRARLPGWRYGIDSHAFPDLGTRWRARTRDIGVSVIFRRMRLVGVASESWFGRSGWTRVLRQRSRRGFRQELHARFQAVGS